MGIGLHDYVALPLHGDVLAQHSRHLLRSQASGVNGIEGGIVRGVDIAAADCIFSFAVSGELEV